MKKYKNLFEDKTEEELTLLYEQFLESEKIGYIPDNALGEIRNQYCEFFESNILYMIQNDLLKAIAKLWYEHHININNENLK